MRLKRCCLFLTTIYLFVLFNHRQKELEEIKVACQKLIEERERSQQELSKAAKLLKVCFFALSLCFKFLSSFVYFFSFKKYTVNGDQWVLSSK